MPEYTSKKKPDNIFRGLMAENIGANVGDIVSTHNVLSGGGHEQNPIMQGSDAKRAIFKGLGTAAEIAIANKIHKNHPKIANILLGGLTAIPALAMMHNMRQK